MTSPTNQYCELCQKLMPIIQDGRRIFDIYRCSGCLPDYNSMYRQLYRKECSILLAESIRLSNFYVVKYHCCNSAGKMKFTIIYKNILGIIEPDNPDFEPVTFSKPVCEIGHLIDLPLYDPEATLHKLSIYATFS